MEERNHKLPIWEMVKADKRAANRRMMIYHVKVEGRRKEEN